MEAMSDKQTEMEPTGAGKVDRGHRVAGETRVVDAHDGKQRARFVRPKRGDLPADMNDGGAKAAPVTTEDVVETPPRASSWEAIEDDAGDCETPDRRGRDPAETQAKAHR
jgi:hypothetical protein